MTLMSDFKKLRVAEQSCFSNPLHPKDFVCHKYCEGPGVPAFFIPGNCQVLFVMEHPDEEEVQQTGKRRMPFTGEGGRVFNVALKKAGLAGDDRLGYTTLVKCRIKNRRSVAKVYNECIDLHLNEELGYARPILVACVGEQVSRQLCPEAFVGIDELYTYRYLWGKVFVSLDKSFLFLPALYDKVGSGAKLKDASGIEMSMELVDGLKVVRDYLVDKAVHKEAAGFKPEDLVG